MARLARKAAESGVAAMVFPELCVTGYTCGDVFFRDDALSAAESALAAFVRETADLPIVSVVGFPERDGNAIFNAAAVTYGGRIAGIVRKRHLPTYREYYEARQFTPAPASHPPPSRRSSSQERRRTTPRRGSDPMSSTTSSSSTTSQTVLTPTNSRHSPASPSRAPIQARRLPGRARPSFAVSDSRSTSATACRTDRRSRFRSRLAPTGACPATYSLYRPFL